jgi:hypothetical protein
LQSLQTEEANPPSSQLVIPALQCKPELSTKPKHKLANRDG